jgi:hypothetical protein
VGRELGLVDEQDRVLGVRDHGALHLGLQGVGVGQRAVGRDALDAEVQAVGDVAEHGVHGERPDEGARQRAEHAADADEVDRRARMRGHELHHRERVRDDGRPHAAVEQRPRDVVGARRGVEEDRLALLHRGRGGDRDGALGLGGHLQAGGERVLVGGDRRHHRAAVGAPREPLALEAGEVAPRGHRRDAELLLELGDGHGAGAPQALDDRGPPGVGQEAAGFWNVRFDRSLLRNEQERSEQNMAFVSRVTF